MTLFIIVSTAHSDISPIRIVAQIRPQSHILLTMANKVNKTPYTIIVKQNILKLVLKTKKNIQRFYVELEESFVPTMKTFDDTDLIDEEEQNRFNEELEKSLRAAWTMTSKTQETVSTKQSLLNMKSVFRPGYREWYWSENRSSTSVGHGRPLMIRIYI